MAMRKDGWMRFHLFGCSVPRLCVVSVIGAGLGLFASPIGPSAQAQTLGARTIGLTLVDSLYQPPSAIRVRKGETVKFVLRNRGKLPHEALIGTVAEQTAHEKEMKAMGPGTMGDTDYAVTVKAGVTKTLTWKFDKAGKFEIACHQPNHYKAGMKVSIIVA